MCLDFAICMRRQSQNREVTDDVMSFAKEGEMRGKGRVMATQSLEKVIELTSTKFVFLFNFAFPENKLFFCLFRRCLIVGGAWTIRLGVAW